MARLLAPGEDVCLQTRPHGIALARPLSRPLVLAGAGAGLVVLGSLLAWPLGIVGAALLAFSALAVFRIVLGWDRTELLLTTERLLVVHGVARRRAAGVRLRQVAALEWEQGILGRLLGYGTIIAGDFEVPYVPAHGGITELLG